MSLSPRDSPLHKWKRRRRKGEGGGGKTWKGDLSVGEGGWHAGKLVGMLQVKPTPTPREVHVWWKEM